MSDEVLLEFFKKNSGWFEVGNFMLDAIRYLSFGFVKILYTIAKSSNELYDKTFELLDFTKWAGIDDFITENKLAITSILAISIFFLGVFLILNHEKKRNIVSTILIAFISITSTAYFMNEINGLLIEGKNAIIGKAESHMSSANEIASGYIYDLLYIDSQGGILNFDQNDGEALASYQLSNDAIDYLMKATTSKINAKIKRKGLEGDSKEVFSKTLETLHEYDGDIPKESIRKLEDGSIVGGFGREEYYQYHVETMPLIIALISLILIFLFVSYKAFKMIYELVFSKILLIFNAADLTGGERTIKLLDSIKNTYLILLFTAVLIKVYTIGANAITTTFASNVWISAIFLVFLSLATIDAPNVVAKITGVDLGVNNEKMAMLGMLMMAGRGLSAVKNTGKSLLGASHKAMSSHQNNANSNHSNQTTNDLSNLDSHLQNHQGDNHQESHANQSSQSPGSNNNEKGGSSSQNSLETNGDFSSSPSINEASQFEQVNENVDMGQEILDDYNAGSFDREESGNPSHPGGTNEPQRNANLERMEKEIDGQMDGTKPSFNSSSSSDFDNKVQSKTSMPTYRSHPLERGSSRFGQRSNYGANSKGEKTWADKEMEKERKDKK